jgi:hypothetical protein
MKRIRILSLLTIVMFAALRHPAAAQQPVVKPPQGRAQRGAGQALPLRDVSKPVTNAPDKQAQKEARKQANADLPKRTEQQIRTARAIERQYLVRFQNQVGLSDEQSLKLSSLLADYVQRQLMLADRQTNAMKRLQELNDQHASDEELKPQMELLNQTNAQLVNSENRFFNEINPQLTVPQQARLQLFMKRTEQRIRAAIQESRQ